MFWAADVLKINFRLGIVCFDKCQDCVCNVPQPESGRCCVNVSFLPSLFFLLLTQKHWRNGMEFYINCVSFVFSNVYIDNYCSSAGFYAPRSSLHNLCENCVLSYCFFPHIQRQIDVQQLSVFNLATKSIAHIVFYFSLLKKVLINVDRKCHHSVRTWKEQDKNHSLGKKF